MAWASALLVSCVLTACHNPESVRDHFDTAVLPVLEQRCGAAVCHGVAPGAEEAGDVIDWELLFWAVDGQGHILDPDEAYEAALRAINTVESPEFSTLLRKPLAVGFGGLPHYGRTAFAGPQDPAYVALRDWIAMEPVGGEDPVPLTEMERLFADTVQPALVEGTCFTASCHGTEAGATPYRLTPGVLGELGIEATRHNYEESLRMLSLDGYPMQSRLLRKSLPLATFGVVHKGTNMDFYAGNTTDGVEAIRRWACAERRLRTGSNCADEEDAPISAFVYVRGPLAPGRAFEVDSFVPGTDIYRVEVSGAEVLRVPSDGDGGLCLRTLLEALWARDIVSVLCEGGGRLSGALLTRGLVDRLYAFVAPILLGDEGLPMMALAGAASPADAPRLADVRRRDYGDDVLIMGRLSGPVVGPPG